MLDELSLSEIERQLSSENKYIPRRVANTDLHCVRYRSGPTTCIHHVQHVRTESYPAMYRGTSPLQITRYSIAKIATLERVIETPELYELSSSSLTRPEHIHSSSKINSPLLAPQTESTSNNNIPILILILSLSNTPQEATPINPSGLSPR